MKSPGIYQEKTNSPGIKATIKIGKHALPNNKINMAIHNFRTKQKERKEKRAAKVSKNFSEGMPALQNKQKTRKIILPFVTEYRPSVPNQKTTF